MPELKRGRNCRFQSPWWTSFSGDYYHSKPTKKLPIKHENGMTSAYNGWLFSSIELVKLETNSRTLDRSGPFASAKDSYLGSHRPMYPLDLSQPMALPLADRAIFPMIVPTKKPLSYKMYKEGANLDAHIRSLEKILWVNGKTNELVVMTLFCTTLTNKVQRWANNYLDIHPSWTWE